MKFQVIVILLLSSISCFSQTKWDPYIGLHVSTDAGAYYIGVSPQIGVNFQFKKELALSAYLHYFPKDLEYAYTDGTFEKGKYHSAIFAFLIERNFYKKENKGLILAGGLAVQYTSEYYTSSWGDDYLKRTILVAAVRIGYSFPIGKNAIAFEINGVGPHVSESGSPPYTIRTTEILTQLSLGTRLIF